MHHCTSAVEPARGLEPLTARLQGGHPPPHSASTSTNSHTPDPGSNQNPRRPPPTRTTNRTTDGARPRAEHLLEESRSWHEDGHVLVQASLRARDGRRGHSEGRSTGKLPTQVVTVREHDNSAGLRCPPVMDQHNLAAGSRQQP